MNPPKGYYRNILKDHFSHVRIAFTHTPIYGCTIIDPANVLRVLDESTDPHAKFYSNGIRNKDLVVIVEDSVNKVYKNNGELYFTT